MVVVCMGIEISKWLWSAWVWSHPSGCGLHGYRDIQVVVVCMGIETSKWLWSTWV